MAKTGSTFSLQGTSSQVGAIAGRTNYGEWDRVTKDLVSATEQEEQNEVAMSESLLGLDGKYARSQAEADERTKLHTIKQTKKQLDKYKQREVAAIQGLTGLLGPPVLISATDATTTTSTSESPSSSAATTTATTTPTPTRPTTVRITRDRIDAGKRVVTIADTSGQAPNRADTIVLTQDLSHLESRIPANVLRQPPKSYPDDAENDVVVVEPTNDESHKDRSVFGLIKAFLSNVHNCTVLIKCKMIAGVLEMHNCSNVTVIVESTGTVATLQIDLSHDVTVEFHNAPSSTNTAPNPDYKSYKYWGDDANDRIFHAGVKNLHIKIIKDGLVELETVADYETDGAVAVGNATAEEYQFVTSVLETVASGTGADRGLCTEAVVRKGSTTGTNARAMTQRELDAAKAMRERVATQAVAMAESMVQIRDKDGNVLVKKTDDDDDAAVGDTEGDAAAPVENVQNNEDDENVEEIYTSMTAEQIRDIVDECEQNKTRGNEAFQAGEYGQAVLLYSLALDKADELPDRDQASSSSSSSSTSSSLTKAKTLFARDIIYSNRAACFLKLGQHEKAETDAATALRINPDNIKALFRRGLALHAMAQYEQALPLLAQAHKIEPKNKQIMQALQFCEVRMTQEHRKRMQGS